MRIVRPMRRKAASWAMLWVLAGCGAEAPGPGTAVVRDSAGVRIVESVEPVWATGEGWRIGEEPLLEIGVVEGEPHYQFSRIAGAARLSDGRIVVADLGAMEIRYFDGEGRHRPGRLLKDGSPEAGAPRDCTPARPGRWR